MDAKFAVGDLVRVNGFVTGGIFRVVGVVPCVDEAVDELGIVVMYGGVEVAYLASECEPALPSEEWEKSVTDLDATTLRVEEVLGDAFVAAHGLETPNEPPDFDPDLEDDDTA